MIIFFLEASNLEKAWTNRRVKVFVVEPHFKFHKLSLEWPREIRVKTEIEKKIMRIQEKI